MSKYKIKENLLSRLRCGATWLTHMKPRLEGTFPPRCQNCRENKTIRHILLYCNLYTRNRKI